MTDSPPYDPRSIANLILDAASQLGLSVTNLALQKLIYFAHALFLVEKKTPLVKGYFEAWQYGPVHPVLYHAFKSSKDKPISFRATKKDIITGKKSSINPPSSADIIRHINSIMLSYGRLTPGRLVDISHAPKAPWKFTVTQSDGSEVYGARIEDIVIIERFKYHKVSVGTAPRSGEPLDEAPPSRN